MTAKSPDAPSDEPVHVFDQTNGLLRDESQVGPDRGRKSVGAKGDVPGATHLVIGGF